VNRVNAVAAADAAMIALWRRSWIASRLQSIACRVQIAWIESRCRHLLGAAGVRW